MGVALALGACVDDSDGDDEVPTAGGRRGGGGQAGASASAAGAAGTASSTGGSSAGSGAVAGGSAGGAAPAAGGTNGSNLSPDAQEYVDAHNRVRDAVMEPTGYAGGAWEPLPPVTWSEVVAASAQSWAVHLRDAENCDLVHDDDSPYGENLAAGSALSPGRAVELWASEVDEYRYSARYVFVAGHYTQIVWRRSTSIGCASAQCGNRSVVVCRYDPPGNFIGGSIY